MTDDKYTMSVELDGGEVDSFEGANYALNEGWLRVWTNEGSLERLTIYPQASIVRAVATRRKNGRRNGQGSFGVPQVRREG